MRIINHLILAVGLAFLLQGCGGRPVQVPTVAPGIALKDICAKYNMQWQWDGVTQVVLLEYKSNKAKALVGSNVVLLGKEKVFLSAPLRRINSTIYVPEDFEAKVIGPFGITVGKAAGGDPAQSKVKSIVIDAGHGGKDPGAQGVSGVLEKDVVLDISKRLKVLLEEAGMKVVMTRDTDVFISLQQRTEIATKANADLFVSVHANSNPSRKMQGIEVYYVKTAHKKDLDEEQRQKNEKAFVARLNADNNAKMVNIVADMLYAFKVGESGKIAQLMVQRMSGHVDAPNRGHRSCRFFVVRNTLVPAVLVETGFLTNRQEEKKLNAGSYRQKLAESLARSILDYASN